jgi:hypothetical protein
LKKSDIGIHLRVKNRLSKEKAAGKRSLTPVSHAWFNPVGQCKNSADTTEKKNLGELRVLTTGLSIVQATGFPRR